MTCLLEGSGWRVSSQCLGPLSLDHRLFWRHLRGPNLSGTQQVGFPCSQTLESTALRAWSARLPGRFGRENTRIQEQHLPWTRKAGSG